jgi:glycosyltransferase involved in cell wall biosynthesis
LFGITTLTEPFTYNMVRMIAFLHGARAFGAVENYVVDLVTGLRLAGMPCVLIYPDDPVLEPFRSLEGGSVRVEPMPPATLLGSGLPALGKIVQKLRALRPEIVHVTDVWSVALVAARLAGTPRVLVTHHTPELPRQDSLMGKVWWGAAWATRPEVIYTSEADRRSGEKNAHVVYLGIDLQRFRQADPALDRNGPVVGNVGRLVPQKGQRFLLEAAPLVLQRHPQARFVLVGEGPARAALEAQVRAAGIEEHVLLTGERSDVPAWLASFDVFALPSLFEGLSYAVIEAQAAGVPVVATPVGGVRDTVVDRQTGLIVPPKDPKALADAICWLLENPREARTLSEEATRRVERFSKERMVQQTIAIYEQNNR